MHTSLSHLHAIELPTPFPVGPITVYLAAAPGEALTLIDTGPLYDPARDALEAGMDRLGYTLADLGERPRGWLRQLGISLGYGLLQYVIAYLVFLILIAAVIPL